jgi:predicted nucleic acid-binding protein
VIVVDTNVLAYRFVDATDSPRRGLAEHLLESERVLLPTLWRHEFLNVLVNCARIRQIDASQASRS